MICVEHVSLEIKKHKILDDISLQINPGEIVGLVGCNGSGKTMLMKCICGFYSIFTGVIRIGEMQLGRDMDFPENIGLIIETPGFIPYYSGFKNLKILASLRGMIGEEELKKSMEMVGLDASAKLPVRKYSLGMRQRLGIAQALMENPPILVLDEPFNGLDKEMSAVIRNTLLEEKKQGKTILISSHNAYDIEVLCDRVYELEHGRLSKN